MDQWSPYQAGSYTGAFTPDRWGQGPFQFEESDSGGQDSVQNNQDSLQI